MDGTRQGGLDGLVVADTALSDVDGDKGRLLIAGDRIEDLAGRVSFEALCARLWALADGQPRTPDSVRQQLGRARLRAFERLPDLAPALRARDAMEALRAAVALLDGEREDEAGITGAVAVFAAAWPRVRAGQRLHPPDPEAGHAADYLRLARGEPASADAAAALDAYLVTVSDHGMNLSLIHI